ncbi:MAG: ATP-dependent helicase [Bacillota bacterium]
MQNIDEILTDNLTPAQKAAAADPKADILCLACAGSGKSRTLAFRIARLIAEGEDPKSIVAFTFTEKAAESMKLRVAGALQSAGIEPTLLGAVYIGTIHSYCQYILSAMDAKYFQYDVLDENRLKIYLMSRYWKLGLRDLQNKQKKYFKIIKEVSNAWKVMNDEMICPEDVTKHDGLLGSVLEKLRLNMDVDQFIDFSLMIRLVVDSLQLGHAGAERAVSNVRHLMVDEYQDVNPAQEALIRELRKRCVTLFVVGDDDQSIYAWRGADVNNILTFADRYPDCSVHTLSHNFRSAPVIVYSAERFAAAELGANRIEKEPEADLPLGPVDFRNLWFDTRDEEARWVTSMIQSLLGTSYREKNNTVRGLTLADFAILMRSTKQPEGTGGMPRHTPFTDALREAGIHYSLEAGGSVFDRPQVSVLRDTFELLRNGSPSRQTALDHFNQFIKPAYPLADFYKLATVLSRWGRLIHAPVEGTRRRVFPQQLVFDLLNAFGLEKTSFDDGTMQDIGLFSRMMQDIEAVYVSIDTTQRFNEILNFLQNVAETGYDTSSDSLLVRPDLVTVSTVHKVKGLEFPVVFVVDVENLRFPKKNKKYEGWLPQQEIGAALKRGAYQTTRDEEARLFYTAITRAERYLYITGSERLPGGKSARKSSPFALSLNDPEISTKKEGLPLGIEHAPSSRRIDETVLPTSFSDIRYYLRCPQDYKFRKIFGFSPPIEIMFGYGKTVHTAICKLHEKYPDSIPTPKEAKQITCDIFHLKHVYPSSDPESRPGAYERAKEKAATITEQYVTDFADDFTRSRQVEARFEIPLEKAVINGAIDLMLREDEHGNIYEASVVDFKTMEGGDEPDSNPKLDWKEMSLQVQLYAKAAKEILGEKAKTGSVHLLKDNQRVEVPVDEQAVNAAVGNIEWAVDRIIHEDFPMRPHGDKCVECDWSLLCRKEPGNFETGSIPPPIRVPGDTREDMVAAFSEYDEE